MAGEIRAPQDLDFRVHEGRVGIWGRGGPGEPGGELFDGVIQPGGFGGAVQRPGGLCDGIRRVRGPGGVNGHPGGLCGGICSILSRGFFWQEDEGFRGGEAGLGDGTGKGGHH